MRKIISLLIISMLLSGCGREEVAVSPKKVNYILLEQSQADKYSQYTGYLLSDEVKKYSFIQGGQILSVNVKKGDEVQSGDVLAVLDSKQVELGKESALASQNLAQNQSAQANINVENLRKSLDSEKIILKQLEDALASEKLKLNTVENTYSKNINQLEDSFKLIEDTYTKNKELVKNGVISQNDFDTIENKYNNSKEELNALYADKKTDINLQNIAITNAQNNIDNQKIKIASIENQIKSAQISGNSVDQQVNQAKIGVSQYENQLDDMTLKSTISGSVVEVVMHDGEVVGAGTPVVVVKSNKNVVKVGVSLDDYKNIKLNENVVVSFNDVASTGKVVNLATYPDEETKTYEIEVEVQNDNIPLGSLVTVKFPISSGDGEFIPISSVVNKDGVNYVYTVTEEGLVNKKEVELGNVLNDKVSVNGLSIGTKIIVDDLNNLQENDAVIID